MKFAIGLVISFGVGVACRYFDIPVGSPAVIPGALIVLAMTAGYSWTNQILNARNRLSTTTHLCGGPTGASVADAEATSSEETQAELAVVGSPQAQVDRRTEP
jgi:XapX domain-containing protein